MFLNLKRWIEKHEILLIILGLITALRIPSLLEPYWYGDEGIYLTIGQSLRRGLVLYKQIHDNKPPFIYWLAAIAGGNLFWFKFLALSVNLASISVFWKLADKWWNKHSLTILSTFVFSLLTTLPLLEGNIANAELFFLLPTVSAFYLLFQAKKANRIFLAGLLLGLAALFKMPAFVEIAIFPLYWFTIREREWFKKSIILGAGGLIPIAISFAYYFAQGNLPAYLIAAGLQNVPYLSSWQAAEGIVGTLKGRAVVLAGLLGATILLRNKFGKPLLLLYFWWFITLFAALLSARPYPHYLLQMTPAIAIAFVFLLQGKNAIRLGILGLSGLLCASFLVFNFYVYPVGEYYKNFVLWSFGQKTSAEYYGWFNSSVNRNYAIAQKVMAGSNPEEKIFIWGDEPMIYALSKRSPVGRFTAKYHINDFSAHQETIHLLISDQPRYIITFSNPEELPGLPALLKKAYLKELEIEGAQIYRLLNNVAII